MVNSFGATYSSETVGNVMSRSLPICHPEDTFETISTELFTKRWESIEEIYVVNAQQKLIGIINPAKVSDIFPHTKAGTIMQPPKTTLSPHLDQEQAVVHAIKDDVISLPVVDQSGILLGAVTAATLIDIMHDEHIEDTLLAAGVHGARGTRLLRRVSQTVQEMVSSRVPWLLIGTAAGLVLGLISSFFEEALRSSIAIAYFIPVVAYVAGSVGAQSSTIAVRTLAAAKVQYVSYLLRELAAGILLGIIVAFFGAIGAFFVSQEFAVSITVGLALFVASALATVLAAAIPFLLKTLGKDPALGSGPIATALLDILSVAVYFIIATVIV